MSPDPAWHELSDRISTCSSCPELAASRRTVVVGEAPAGARLLLVGEAPGAAEDASGRPFVGRSGQLLDRLLTDAGLDRRSVAVLNILKCRPPGNRRPAPAEIGRCTGWLAQQVALVAPAVMCVLGGTATAWALGRSARIGTARGRPHRVGGRLVVASYHPSAALRFGPAGAPLAALRTDLAMVARLVAESST
ncbi:MAG: uracil-DNA glycosylase [Actinomycetota bacterium]|nr:uracil-DNA glycosylase [Actinomycetota bacterium]